MTNKQDKPQRFIFFQSKYIGKLLKIRINLSSLVKFAKQDKDGNYIVDIFISKRRTPTKNSFHIAWVEESEPLPDNTKMVEDLFAESSKKELTP